MKTLVALFISALLLQGGALILVWNSKKKHSWSDFKGDPKADPNLNAKSYITFSMNHRIVEDTLFFECANTFNCSLSWYRKEAATPALLQHEDLHFDINEVYCRKLKKLISQTALTKNNFREVIGKIAQGIFKQTEDYQRLYEKDTNYGSDAKEQQRWNQLLPAQLAATQSFSPAVIKIVFKP